MGETVEHGAGTGPGGAGGTAADFAKVERTPRFSNPRVTNAQAIGTRLDSPSPWVSRPAVGWTMRGVGLIHDRISERHL